jgi:hypothetical protein
LKFSHVLGEYPRTFQISILYKQFSLKVTHAASVAFMTGQKQPRAKQANFD